MSLPLRSGPGGWQLWELLEPGGTEARFELRGLPATPGQVLELCRQRAMSVTGWRVTRPGTSRQGEAVDLMITWDEAFAIWRLGLPPLDVLFPRLRLRSLSEREMMSA